MRSPAVTTRGKKGESYPEFTKRTAEDYARVKAKCDALDQYVPRCTYCGETCNPEESGKTCKENGALMFSRWARKLAEDAFYSIGHFARGGWTTTVENLAPWFDRVRAGVEDASTPRGSR